MTNKIQKDVSSLIAALNKTRMEFKKIESDYSKKYTNGLLDMIEIIIVDAAHGQMNPSKIIDFVKHARAYAHYLPVSQTVGCRKGHVPQAAKTHSIREREDIITRKELELNELRAELNLVIGELDRSAGDSDFTFGDEYDIIIHAKEKD